MRHLRRFWIWCCQLPAPIDVIAPPDPVDDLHELRRLRGLIEIQRSTRENVMYVEFTKARRPR